MKTGKKESMYRLVCVYEPEDHSPGSDSTVHKKWGILDLMTGKTRIIGPDKEAAQTTMNYMKIEIEGF